MGEAKRRKAGGDQWFDALTTDEKAIAQPARQIFRRLVENFAMVEGCYYCAFLLRKFLKEQKPHRDWRTRSSRHVPDGGHIAQRSWATWVNFGNAM